MNDHLYEPNNSIVETSLAELAFALFFVLLVFTVFKINEAQTENNTLEEEVSVLKESLTTASEVFQDIENFDPEEVFKELTRGKLAQESLKKLEDEKEALNQRLDTLKELEQQLKSSPQEIASKVQQLNNIERLIAGEDNETNLVEKVKELLQKNNDFKGQNKNLRAQLGKEGNGLDHPPCWADPNTGSIQYAYNVIINEASTEFIPGWPESRNQQALADPHIMQVAGTYTSNQLMWSATDPLYQDSVKEECRHFVRVYDHAKSKSSFKRYLLGIETHFYKYLSKQFYVKTTGIREQ